MDEKDEALFKLQGKIFFQESYIGYLQHLLQKQGLEFEDYEKYSRSIQNTNEFHNEISNAHINTNLKNSDNINSQESISNKSREISDNNEQASHLELNSSKNVLVPEANDLENFHTSENLYNTAERQPNTVYSSSRRVFLPKITSALCDRFRSYFHGRDDVYANRAGKCNPKTGKYAYYPQCYNFFKAEICLKAIKYNNYQHGNEGSFGNNTKDIHSTTLKNQSRFQCSECKYKSYKPLTNKALTAHMLGFKDNCSDVVGIYPILLDEKCYFLVFDFDDHSSDSIKSKSLNNVALSKAQSDATKSLDKGDKKTDSNIDTQKQVIDDVKALISMLNIFRIPHLLERSRSGKGYHIWIFFSEAIEVKLVREFGNAVLTCGSDEVNLKSFKTYDRMIPASDKLPEGGLGNLVALPLQGKALLNGNSAFLDDNFEIFQDQFSALFSTDKLNRDFVVSCLEIWNFSPNNQYGAFFDVDELEDTSEITSCSKEVYNSQYSDKNQLQFSKAKSSESSFLQSNSESMCPMNVIDGKSAIKTQIVFKREDLLKEKVVLNLSHRIFIKEDTVKPRFLNQLRRFSSFFNQEFYKNLRMGYSNLNTPRIISCFTEEKGYLGIPRGLISNLERILKLNYVNYEVIDHLNKGTKINVSFNGQLYSEQQQAVQTLLKYNHGILQAATAFGKTVVGAYIISKLKVNTLIVVNSEAIALNWLEDFDKFLIVNETIPTYKTAKGRILKRKSIYGFLSSKKNTLNSIIDVVMVQSLGAYGNIKELVKKYGLVIVDECHHSAAESYFDALSQINSNYFFGFSATPSRQDGLDKKLYYLFGPTRYRFTAIDKVNLQGIPHFVISRFIPFTMFPKQLSFNEITNEITKDKRRNEIIVSDIKDAILNNRTPLVLTRRVEHARVLFDSLRECANHIILLIGDLSAEEKRNSLSRLKQVPDDESLILIATGQYIGEGFNYPRLDTLFLTSPISSKNNVEQYAGRLNRDYAGKKDVIIYDYVDDQVSILSSMFKKRLTTYKKIGFSSIPSLLNYQRTSEEIKTFFDGSDYSNQFHIDISHAQKEIVFLSDAVSEDVLLAVINRHSFVMQSGVKISIVTSASVCSDSFRNIEDICSSTGVILYKKNYRTGNFMVIDRELIWYGSNFIEGVKKEETLLRFKSIKAAAEILGK
ncbi:MAG TPA: hypothetical protein DCR21_04835 [Succinivibrionaceae bacterium]|nr:hypothetical protein [Succinivibrionaceae bacterium]